LKDKISDKDKKDWDEFIKNDEKLPVKDIFFSKKKTTQNTFFRFTWLFFR